MAIENDFLPFAVGSGANVLTQAQYAALTSLLQNGFTAGIAPSVQLNKVWRQSSIMASVIAQFIAQQTGQNAIDDGTTATLLANLTAAIGASSPGVVGATRNLSMSVTAASATATLTADEIIVETALGGLRYCLPSFSKTINLATTGAGGMDTGTATANGFLGIYTIYNPTSAMAALLGTMEGSTPLPSVYGGANMPSGYTASALVAVVPINSTAGQFKVFLMQDRVVSIPVVAAITSTSTVTNGALSLTSFVPKTARTVSGIMTLGNSSGASMQIIVQASPTQQIGLQSIEGYTYSGAGQISNFTGLAMASPQTIGYSFSGPASGSTWVISVSGYSF